MFDSRVERSMAECAIGHSVDVVEPHSATLLIAAPPGNRFDIGAPALGIALFLSCLPPCSPNRRTSWLQS
jgi:hypothetical protein